MTQGASKRRLRAALLQLDQLDVILNRHWLLILNLLFGLFIGLTVVAPLLMALGLTAPGWVLYFVYGLTCHQLPERSYFLFGPRLLQTYSWEELLAQGMDPAWPRGFIGSPALGYKMALAHRNTAIHAALFVGGLLYGLARRLLSRHPRALSPIWYAASVLPMFLDGGSHLVSEATGLGFRNDNAWLATLMGGLFPPGFYFGEGLGSFNWLMRTLTGALFGLATIWVLYPRLEPALGDVGRRARVEPVLEGMAAFAVPPGSVEGRGKANGGLFDR